jgi:hypothetical protein
MFDRLVALSESRVTFPIDGGLTQSPREGQNHRLRNTGIRTHIVEGKENK